MCIYKIMSKYILCCNNGVLRTEFDKVLTSAWSRHVTLSITYSPCIWLCLNSLFLSI